MRRRLRAAAALSLFVAGCNALVGIDQATVRPPDSGEPTDASGDGSFSADGPPDATAPLPEGGDAATDTGVDAGVDSSVDAGLDGGVDSASDAGSDAPSEAGSIVCASSTPPRPASVGIVSQGPAIAYSPTTQLWGIAWTTGTSSVAYNAVDSAGNIQSTSADVTVVAAAASTLYGSPPGLASAGSDFVLAYGVRNSAGSAFPAVELLTPGTGARVGNPANGTSASDTTSNAVGGVAVDDAADAIVTASRGGFIATATVARANLFTATPAQTTSLSPSATTYTTAVAWNGAVSRFGMAYLVDGSSSGGMVVTYTTALVAGASYPFTQSGDQPAFGLSGDDVAIAGAGGSFAVAWVDGGHTSEKEIWLTSVDALTGAHLSPTSEVQASVTSAYSKSYPRVAWDGRSIVVAWLESTGSGDFDVMVQRFGPALVALDAAPRCVSCGTSSWASSGAIDLAVAGPNDYGIAFQMQLPSNQFFSHMTCTGP